MSQFSSLGVQDKPEFFLRNGRNEVNHSRILRVQRIGGYAAVQEQSKNVLRSFVEGVVACRKCIFFNVPVVKMLSVLRR